jgi:23S rRNA G2445 N2-methylase RlmL
MIWLLRFFHDLIPFEVRKILAAFYTHPVAAEILADLTVGSWDEIVLDPACGSGTLLVSAYKRKMSLYQKLHGFKDLDAIHKKFLENDLTGIDIMPFAAHITTLNLATQDIEQETN